MEATIQISPKDYVESRKLYRIYDPGHFRRIRRLSFFSGTLFAASLLGISLNSDAWPYMVLAFAISASLLAGPYLQRRRTLKQLANSEPITLRIARPEEDDRMISESNAAISFLKWEPYAGWLEGNTMFILLIGKNYHIFPKRCFNEEQVNEFRDLLRRKLPTATPIS